MGFWQALAAAWAAVTVRRANPIESELWLAAEPLRPQTLRTVTNCADWLSRAMPPWGTSSCMASICPSTKVSNFGHKFNVFWGATSPCSGGDRKADLILLLALSSPSVIEPLNKPSAEILAISVISASNISSLFVDRGSQRSATTSAPSFYLSIVWLEPAT